MLTKFFARGTGRGKTPVDYVLDKTDSQGIERKPSPELLRGNPTEITRLIDNLDFQHKYTSGVLSFAPEDAPTDEQQKELMDDFERFAFAGLDKDQYSILWVRHTHTSGGRVELHFISPRVELTTGKSLNIAPPNWQNYFSPWQSCWNLKHNWARPDDPLRARPYSPHFEALVTKQKERANGDGLKTLSGNNLRTYVTEELIMPEIKKGNIHNREDIVNELKKAGLEINRQGNDYITIYHPEVKKKVRLKGGIYHKSWQVEQKKKAETKAQLKEKFEEDLKRVRENYQQRREFHQSRYGIKTEEKISKQETLVEFLDRKLGTESIFSNEPPERLREIVKASKAEMKMNQKENIELER